MNNIDIDKFIPKFLTKEEIAEKNYEFCNKLLALDIDEQALYKMLAENEISENDYLKMKNKIDEKRKSYLYVEPSLDEIKNYLKNH